MYGMIRNVEFTNVRNEFLDHPNRDIESIRSTKNVLVFADKSTNLYELSRENYQKLLHDNITQTHKKAPKNAKRDIDRKTRSFAKTLVGLVSKKYLNDIIADVSCKTEVTQWRNTATVINWFKTLSDKHKQKIYQI